MTTSPNSQPASSSQLVRGLGLTQATALNVANMVGIGPFITIPLFIGKMGGPHALIGWVVAAVLVLCDGLVWSELGAALPGSGGTYHFLREIFGRYRWGRLVPFLFIWQFLLSGTLEMASGYIGAADYVQYVFPNLEARLAGWGIPHGMNCLAAASCVVVTLALCRRIQVVGWVGVLLCTGTIATVLTVIISGLTHFDASLLKFPPDAIRLDGKFALGLGGAMLIAIYDYLGYYNICHLGEEVSDPGRTIPRAVIISVVLVAVLYLTMNLSIIGVVPWQAAIESKNIAAQFMEQLFGRGVAVAFTWLILWTVVACMFAITLGYSRIPLAAARNGDFFRVFAYVHPRDRYPVVSLLAVGGLTAVFCFLPLGDVITAAVTVRILLQFIPQITALHLLRVTRPDVQLPFRMWLYPLPSLLAAVGWLFVFGSSDWIFWLLSFGVIITGCVAFLVWQEAIQGRWGTLKSALRAIVFSASFAAALLTFPSSVPWMIAFWLLWYTLSVLRGKASWLPVAACLTVIVTKRLPWSPALCGAALVMFATGVFNILQCWTSFHGRSRQFGWISVVALWLGWVATTIDWHVGAHCNNPAALRQNRPVVCLGDSLSSGETLDGAYAPHLQRLISIPVVDLSGPGYTTADVVKQLATVIQANPQVVVLEIGGNDFLQGRGRRTIQTNLEAIIATARKIGSDVILMEIPRGFIIDPLDGLERRIARQQDLELISDTTIRMLVLWSPYAPPGMWTERRLHLSDDGLHPNAHGAQHLAESIAKAMVRMYGRQILAPSDPARP